ncbi:MAG: 4Fe-4S binding protein [Thermodesulfobacteriota bacterium]
MKVKRKIIQIDEEKCTGCGQCVVACAEGAIRIVDGKARVISDNLCDGLGACIGECPEDALHIIEREADEFDEKAVEKHLESQHKPEPPATMPCGCPSAQIQTFAAATPCQAANQPTATGAPGAALSHWPIQIRLVPPTAPFLKGADLLVAADCAPAAFPRFHSELLPGRAVMIGCPKFDDRKDYVEKFAQVFRTAGLKSITCLIMEVPCCAGLPVILREAMQASGVTVPMEVITVSARGEIIERRKY